MVMIVEVYVPKVQLFDALKSSAFVMKKGLLQNVGKVIACMNQIIITLIHGFLQVGNTSYDGNNVG